jgi:LAO/AO transport system kinase
MDSEALVGGVLAGDRRAVARAISAVEDGSSGLEQLSEGIFASTGRAATIGLTGAPGVGKSTLAAGLVRECRTHDLGAAVLAVDPTSPYTGGALLGDRVRMQEHATDENVFIRSMATRGHLGGMALAAPEAVRILDAAGYDRVVVETVGVGQAEVDVAAATDTAVVVLAPGMGDAVQMAKAGILEVADVFVVNKADRDGAGEVVREVRQMLHLGAARDWDPPVLMTSAVDHEGVQALWEAIETHRDHLAAGGALAAKRRARLLREVEALAAERFRLRIAATLEADDALADDLVERRIDPYAAAAMLVRKAQASRRPRRPRGGTRPGSEVG